MTLADAVQGGKRPSQTITWADSGGTALDLTGATITARIKNSASTTVVSDGTFTITNATAGQFRWDYGDTDIASAGNYSVQFTAVFVSSPTPAKTFVENWKVREAI